MIYNNDATVKIMTLIERGEKLTFPERSSEWQKHVIDNVNNGFDLISENTLEIMEALENGATLEETQEILKKQNHSSVSRVVVCDAVLMFSENGKTLWEKEMDNSPLTAERLAWYAQVVHENAEYAKNKTERKTNTN